LGSMVEVPSYAFGLNKPKAKFFSIGSNDLSSFLHQENRYEAESDLLDHSFLNALKTTVEAGDKHDISVSICGDMASDHKYSAVLVGLGFKNISCQIQSAPLMKEIISRVDVEEASLLVDALLDIEDPQERREVLYKFNEERLGVPLDESIQLDWTPPQGDFDPAPSHDI
jgi:phosphoenolpyruvate-protein kinase (PTS system EI component)